MRLNRLFLCCAVLFASVSAYAQSLIVVTDSQHPVTNIPDNVQVIELDAADKLHDQLFSQLPDDPAQAQKIARERLGNFNSSDHAAQRSAVQSAVDAWTIGITKIPAVIVDQRYVIYGESDVEQAIQRIHTYKEAQK